MVLLKLANTIKIENPSFTDSFVIEMQYSYSVASWWTSTFGAPDEAVTVKRPSVLNVRVDNVDYTETTSYANVVANERTWYLDDNAFYIHLDHSVVFNGVVIQYGKIDGYSDTGVVFIDDVQFLPLITKAPEINRQEDIQGYQKLRLISGSVELANLSGRLDALKDSSLIGNEARLAYLPNEAVIDGVANASDVVDQADYFVEKASYGAATMTLDLQDTRKLDKVVPTRTLATTDYPNLSDSLDGKLVQLVYGACRSVKCSPVNSKETGTLSATYRCCEFLTSITQVRVKINDTWTVVSTSSQDLANGTFTIASARAGTGQDPYECQADVVGIPVVNAPDIIVDLYNRFVNQAFNSTFYDTATWTANSDGIPTCGLVISEKKPILDLIPLIQNGIYPSFRFDTTAEGKKTIRRDDKTRTVDWFVPAQKILNIDVLNPQDVSDYLFGSIILQYDKDHTEDVFRVINVSTYEQDVIENYQWSNSTTLETLLSSLVDAQVMADAKALEFSVPIRTLQATVLGDEFFGVEIYDIMQLDTAMNREEVYSGEFSEREFFGVVICQVIGVQPGYSDKTLNVTLKVLDREPEVEGYTVLETELEEWFLTEDDLLLLGDS